MEIKQSSSTFSIEERLEICEWLDMGFSRLDKLIKVADNYDLYRLRTHSGKDDLLEALLQKVDILGMQPDMTSIKGGCVGDGTLLGFDLHVNPSIYNYNKLNGDPSEIVYIQKALTAESCDEINEYYFKQALKNGVAALDLNSITCWDPEFAREMFITINGVLDAKVCDRYTSTDHWQFDKYAEYYNDKVKDLTLYPQSWRPVGVTPLVRLKNYVPSDERFGSYDKGYIYDNPRYRTLMSGILYLTSNQSGATRFIRDGEESKKVCNRDHSDHLAAANDQDVLRIFYPDKGSILLYDHRLCHDLQLAAVGEGLRTSIRFDVVYERN